MGKRKVAPMSGGLDSRSFGNVRAKGYTKIEWPKKETVEDPEYPEVPTKRSPKEKRKPGKVSKATKDRIRYG